MRVFKVSPKLLFFIVMVFVLHARSVAAFFAPGLIAMVGAAIGGFIYHLFVIIAAFVVSLFVTKKTHLKKTSKNRLFLFIVVIFIVLTFSLFGAHFFRIYRLNNTEISLSSYTISTQVELLIQQLNNSKCYDQYYPILTQQSFSENDIEEVADCLLLEKYGEDALKDFEARYRVDFDDFSQAEFDSFLKIGLTTEEDNIIKGAYTVPDYYGVVANNSILESYLEEVDPLKTKKIIMFCSGSGSAVFYGFLGRTYGHDVYYTGIRDTSNPNYIDLDRLELVQKTRSILILPESQIPSNQELMIILQMTDGYLSPEQASLFKPSQIYYYGLITEKHRGHREYVERNIYDRKNNETIMQQFNEDLLNSALVCKNDLHCMLTQHLLYTYDSDVSRIYMLDPRRR
jgi:hypothetical protein